jgi:hypothetical protein
LDPNESVLDIVDFFINSHGLVLNLDGLYVKAPTGHISIILPDNSDLSVFFLFDVICIDSFFLIIINSFAFLKLIFM